MDSKALTKIQSVILASIIVVAAVCGGIAYVLLSSNGQISDAVKIGICADLDSVEGSAIWQGAVLAAEQVNAEGGVLGRDLEIVAEDDDSETPPFDIAVSTNAMNRLITVHKVDFIINGYATLVSQDIACQHKKILFCIMNTQDNLTQRVDEDYDTYKYFFRTGIPNGTSALDGTVESLEVCREHTGFNKVALVRHEIAGPEAAFVADLEGHGFEVVYSANVPLETVDFSSYFAKAEAAGAEILYPIILGQAGVPFVKEYSERQSPMVMWGYVVMAAMNNFWELTEGKCEYVSTNGFPVVTGYPLTTKTISTREAYVERWNQAITNFAGTTFDTVRFILPDAIKRAGTIETEAVIAALEKTEVETSMARRFVFTSSHDIFVGEAGPNRPAEEYFLVCLFQWQDGVQVPVYPIEIMEEAGATYKYPPWRGPWSK